MRSFHTILFLLFSVVFLEAQSKSWHFDASFIHGLSDRFELTPNYQDRDFIFFNSGDDLYGYHIGLRGGLARQLSESWFAEGNILFRWYSNGYNIVFPESELKTLENPRPLLYQGGDYVWQFFYNHHALELGLRYDKKLKWITLSAGGGASLSYNY